MAEPTYKPGLEITTAIGCPNGCVYCPQDKLIAAYGDQTKMMSFDTFCVCLDNCPTEVGIFFSGFCEPFLNPQCVDMILEADKRGHEVTVNTVLSHINQHAIDAIKHIPFVHFHVHLPDDKMRVKADSQYFDKVKSVIHAGIVNLDFRYHSKIDPVLPDIVHVVSEKPVCTRAGNIGHSEKRECLLQCCRDWGRHVLLPDGRVVLCCMDYGLKHVIGNLLDCRFEELQGDEYNRIIEAMADPESDILCRYCENQNV